MKFMSFDAESASFVGNIEAFPIIFKIGLIWPIFRTFVKKNVSKIDERIEQRKCFQRRNAQWTIFSAMLQSHRIHLKIFPIPADFDNL